jgi:transposase
MYYLGIDIAKHNHVASLIDDRGKVIIKTIKFTNDAVGYKKLIAAVTAAVTDGYENDCDENDSDCKGNVVVANIAVAMEATGHYWLSLFSALIDDGFSVSVYNPFQIKSFRGAYHNRSQKTDVIDAVIIANYIRVFGGEATGMPSEPMLSLKQLTRYRSGLVQNISAAKNQVISILDKIFPEFSSLLSDVFGETGKAILQAAPTPETVLALSSKKLLKIVSVASRGRFKQDFVDRLKTCAKDSFGIKLTTKACAFELRQLINTIIFLEEQVDELNVEIKAIYSEMDEFLTTIPGIGNVLASIILAEIGDIEKFSDPAKLVAFTGIDPSTNQSGQKVSGDEKISKRGSPHLRHAIHTAAFVAISNDPHLREYYDRKKAEGKHHYVALAGVQRKLLQIIWAVLKERRPYRPYCKPDELLPPKSSSEDRCE